MDLIVTDQPNLFVNYCHHQIIHRKINISVPSRPPYKRQIWDYAKADKDEIPQFLTNIDWISKFKNLSTYGMVQQFTSTVMGIMSHFIPNKMIICDDKDPPSTIKTAVKRTHRVYNKFAEQGHKPDEWEPVRMICSATPRMERRTTFRLLDEHSNPALCLKYTGQLLIGSLTKKRRQIYPHHHWKMDYLSPISRRKLTFSTIFRSRMFIASK